MSAAEQPLGSPAQAAHPLAEEPPGQRAQSAHPLAEEPPGQRAPAAQPPLVPAAPPLVHAAPQAAGAAPEAEEALPVERRPSLVRRLLADYGAAAGVVLAMLIAWQGIVTAAGLPVWLLPVPTEVARALGDDWSRVLGPATGTTISEVLLGFLLATALGMGIAVVLHLCGPIRRALYPLLIASQTVPIIVLAPILVVLFGYGLVPKLVIVALICFFPIVVNGLDGLASVEDEYISVMRTLHASRWAIFRRVELPAALPFLFSGMRIAATYASIGAVFGEWAGSNAGLGYVMLEATPNLQTARIFAAIFVLTVISVLLFGTVSIAERVVAPWSPRARPGQRARHQQRATDWLHRRESRL